MFFRYISVLFCLFSCVHDSFADADTGEVCKHRGCVVIIDAGSTGSRVHLYAYDNDENNNPVNINELYTKKINPGAASLELKKAKVSAYIANLMMDVPEQNLPVYFYATAGMRLLTVKQQQDFYRLLKQWFWTQPQWKLLEARTISGSEEGVFGWLATNYQLDSFNASDKPLASFIEIGGASTQIVFPIDKLEQIDKQDITRVNVYGRQILLFSHSFLGLGATEVANRFENESTCYPIGYTMPNGTIAQGDATACQQTVSESINKDNAITSITKIARDNNPTTLWYTVGAVSLIAKKAPLAFTNGQITAQDMLQKVDTTYCQSDWQTQQATYADDQYLIKNCLISSFYYSLTVNSYGIQPEQVINTMPEGKSGDWTIGVVLHQPQTNVYNLATN